VLLILADDGAVFTDELQPHIALALQAGHADAGIQVGQ